MSKSNSNIFILNPYEIIKHWRDFRSSIITKDKIEILSEINKFWWKAPYEKYSLNYEKPDTWPTPWELIFENKFDETARAYMMAETIFMLNIDVFKNSKINIIIIKDYEFEEIKSILHVDGFILNYRHDCLEKYSDIVKSIHLMLIYEKINGKWTEIQNF